MDQLEKELELPSGQLMGLFNRSIRKVVQVNVVFLSVAFGRIACMVEHSWCPDPIV